MKISRYGGRSFGREKKSAPERAATFRKRYKAGQIIHGVLIKWEQPKLGWVQINDQTLLANILTEPNPGDHLTFIIQQLNPDIILKEIGPDDLNAQGIYIDPVDATRQFITRRAAFQAQAHSIFKEICGLETADQRQHALLQKLIAYPETAALFFKTQKSAADLNSILKRSRLYYMPWLVPNALNHETVLKVRIDEEDYSNSFFELLFAIDLPPSTPARFKIMYKKPQCGFKLLADDQNLKTILGVNLKHSFSEFLSVEKIPAQNYGGFLSALLEE